MKLLIMMSSPLSYYILPLRHSLFLNILFWNTLCLVMHGTLKWNSVLEVGWGLGVG